MKKFLGKKIGVSVCLAAMIVLSFSIAASASGVNPIKGVVFHGDINCGGVNTSVILEGSYTCADLARYGFTDDWASSVEIADGYKVYLYQDDNFQGTCWMLSRNDYNSENFRNFGGDNKVSSIRVEKDQKQGVVFHGDVNYEGTSTSVISEGRYTLADLERYGFVDDWASSVRIPDGYKVYLYQEDNFEGTYWMLSRNDYNSTNFRNFGGDNTVSSIIVEKDPIQGVVFHENLNCEGSSTSVIPEGSYTLADLEQYGFVNNWASSVKISDGYKVYLYRDDNFQGSCWILAMNDYNSLDFRNFNGNDTVSSIRVEKK